MTDIDNHIEQDVFTLVVIDDDPIFITLIKQLVRIHGNLLRCLSFTDPQEALESLANLKPHLLFIDINMPVLSGWDVLNELQTVNFDKTDIYIVTSSVDQNDKLKAEGYSFVKGFVSKPVTVSKFRTLINLL